MRFLQRASRSRNVRFKRRLRGRAPEASTRPRSPLQTGDLAPRRAERELVQRGGTVDGNCLSADLRGLLAGEE
jgi:hypothetical protein